MRDHSQLPEYIYKFSSSRLLKGIDSMLIWSHPTTSLVVAEYHLQGSDRSNIFKIGKHESIFPYTMEWPADHAWVVLVLGRDKCFELDGRYFVLGGINYFRVIGVKGIYFLAGFFFRMRLCVTYSLD